MSISRLAIASSLLVALTQGQAAEINLTGIGYVTYGDANSYSLPIAEYQTGSSDYSISSTPGQIKDLVVLATGSEGGGLTTNYDGMDDAYSTPTGVSGEEYFYFSDDAYSTYRGTTGDVAFNGDNTWDASVESMLAFLEGDDMVFFFNNNNVNSGGSSLQSLAAWMRIWVTDDAGALVDNSTFELTNNDGTYDLVSLGGGGTFAGDVADYTVATQGAGNPEVTDFDTTDFVLSGGDICVATANELPAGSAPIPVDCALGLVVGDPIPGTLFTVAELSGSINHNLGADHVAYAVLFPELNALLASLAGTDGLADYTMHVDLRLGCEPVGTALANDDWMSCTGYDDWGTELNNGFEQLFIGRAFVDCPIDLPECQPTQVSEPAPLMLFSFGLILLSLGFYRRRAFMV